MAKAEKYRIDFKSLDGYDCRVSFFFEGFIGSITNLTGAARPFVLREFNTDENLFKPIRPQMAEIQFATDSFGVQMDAFLSDADTDIEVRFAYGDLNVVYWRGFLLQDNYQETWEDTYHVITLRASDGLGYMKDNEITNNGAEITAKTTPLDFIKYASQKTVQTWNKFTVFNNLFHDSMTDSATYTGLDQCKIDPKTFQIQSTEYEDSYTVMEKINKAFNQTLFMYNDVWHIFRLEELYTPKSENFRGFTSNSGSRTSLNRRYDINVGVNEEVKPISPQMLRYIKRKTKKDIIKFPFESIVEIIPNGTFSRGALIGSGPTYKQFNVDNWTSSATLTRQEDYTGINGRLIDTYVFMTLTGITDELMISEQINVFAGDKIEFAINFQYLFNAGNPGLPLRVAAIKLTGNTGGNFYLNEEGRWSSVSATSIRVPINASSNADETQWNSVSVTSDPLPDNGKLEIWLVADGDMYLIASTQVVKFKGLEFNVIENFNGDTANNITGVDASYTKSTDNLITFEDQVALQDGFSYNFKGTIYQTDGNTITDSDWYRYRYSTESFSFRRQNLTAYWENNRYNRNKIDATFYGLKFNNEPIGLINTINFVDDDPDKIYAILNLKEIDFSSGTWSATLLEVWDDVKDANTIQQKTFDADVTTGTFNSPSLIPFTIVTAADFTITGGNTITYNGSGSINTNLVISVSGNINSTISTPVTTTFNVKQNSTTIKTQTYPVFTNPQAFTFNLSPSGTITINPGDTFTITVSSNITQIQYTSGGFTCDYTAPATITYDTFEDIYTYK